MNNERSTELLRHSLEKLSTSRERISNEPVITSTIEASGGSGVSIEPASKRPSEVAPLPSPNRATAPNLRERLLDLWVVIALAEVALSSKAKSQDKWDLVRELEDSVRELAGDRPSPSVVSLALTAAVNQFAMRIFEARYLNALHGGRTLEPSFHQQAQRNIDRAHHRYVQSLKAIAQIRRLNLPTLEIHLDSSRSDNSRHIP